LYRRERAYVMHACGLEEIISLEAVLQNMQQTAKKSIRPARCIANSFRGLLDD
jgi:hypothetical protein